MNKEHPTFQAPRSIGKKPVLRDSLDREAIFPPGGPGVEPGRPGATSGSGKIRLGLQNLFKPELARRRGGTAPVRHQHVVIFFISVLVPIIVLIIWIALRTEVHFSA